MHMLWFYICATYLLCNLYQLCPINVCTLYTVSRIKKFNSSRGEVLYLVWCTVHTHTHTTYRFSSWHTARQSITFQSCCYIEIRKMSMSYLIHVIIIDWLFLLCQHIYIMKKNTHKKKQIGLVEYTYTQRRLQTNFQNTTK